MSTIDEIKAEMRAELMAARDITVKADAERREMTDDEVTLAAAHVKAYEGKKKELERKQQHEVDAESVKSLLAGLGDELGLEQNEPGQKSTPGGFVLPSKQKSIGQLFVESQQYKSLMSQFVGGHVAEKTRVQSGAFGVKALVTGTSDTSGGAFVQNDATGIYETLGRRPLTVRDLVSVRQTTSDTVEYVRQTAQATAAAPVAEATTSEGPTYTANTTTGVVTETRAAGGGYKPEGAFAFEKVTTAVKTIAEWVPATRRSLADASQLRGLIDAELRADLAEEEEDQILNGNGTGENFTGLLNTSGIQTQAAAADIFTAARQARRKVKTVGRSTPTAYLMNPEDWEKYDLAKGSDGHFLGAGPFGNQGANLWALPVVESEAVPVGTALVGDFRKAVIWDREQASISITDSHADFFIRNLVAVLGEQREAFGVIRPSAFVKFTL